MKKNQRVIDMLVTRVKKIENAKSDAEVRRVSITECSRHIDRLSPKDAIILSNLIDKVKT